MKSLIHNTDRERINSEWKRIGPGVSFDWTRGVEMVLSCAKFGIDPI